MEIDRNTVNTGTLCAHTTISTNNTLMVCLVSNDSCVTVDSVVREEKRGEGGGGREEETNRDRFTPLHLPAVLLLLGIFISQLSFPLPLSCKKIVEIQKIFYPVFFTEKRT